MRSLDLLITPSPGGWDPGLLSREGEVRRTDWLPLSTPRSWPRDRRRPRK